MLRAEIEDHLPVAALEELVALDAPLADARHLREFGRNGPGCCRISHVGDPFLP